MERRVNELALFAGAGGGILGGHLLGWRTICAVELDTYAVSVLVARQNDGHLPAFPIWDDVCTFDGRPWRGRVDVISGGFPCQDISAAGKGKGIDGERSGLWREFARIIREVRPRFVFVENSPMLTCRGLGRVLGDLAAMGFDLEWGVVSAEESIWSYGTPAIYHERDRLWIVAKGSYANRVRASQSQGSVANKRRRFINIRQASCYKGCNTNGLRLEKRQGEPSDDGAQQSTAERASWWQSEPAVGRVAHGVAHRVDRLRAIGNGQVPAVVALAWRILYRRLTGDEWSADKQKGAK